MYDFASAFVEFDGGFVASLETRRYNVHGCDIRLELFGERGSLTTKPKARSTVQGHFDYGNHV